jgi:hypothetical protein
MSKRQHGRATQTDYALQNVKRDGGVIHSLPPRYVKHGRRRKRPPQVRSPFLTIILLAFLSIIITLIVFSYWELY